MTTAPLTEHEALKLAIAALNSVTNTRLGTGILADVKNTYALIPVLEKALIKTDEQKGFKPHIFIQYSVEDVREFLNETENPKEDFPCLSSLTDADIDRLLAHCAYKNWQFWDYDGTDYSILEDHALTFFKGQY